jgi:hypothetical protein
MKLILDVPDSVYSRYTQYYKPYVISATDYNGTTESEWGRKPQQSKESVFINETGTISPEDYYGILGV